MTLLIWHSMHACAAAGCLLCCSRQDCCPIIFFLNLYLVDAQCLPWWGKRALHQPAWSWH